MMKRLFRKIVPASLIFLTACSSSLPSMPVEAGAEQVPSVSPASSTISVQDMPTGDFTTKNALALTVCGIPAVAPGCVSGVAVGGIVFVGGVIVGSLARNWSFTPVSSAVYNSGANSNSNSNSGNANRGNPNSSSNTNSNGSVSGKRFKDKNSGQSGKEAANDAPSWVKHDSQGRPYQGESGSQFADRMMRQRYGNNWRNSQSTGPTSEYNKIKKYGDRAFY